MQIFDITVPAFAPFVVHAPGRYIKYVSGSSGGGDATLVITPGGMGGQKITLAPGQAYRISDTGKTPDSWTLSSYVNGATIVGKVIVGDGRIDDNTFSGVMQTIDGGRARTLAGGSFSIVPYYGGSSGLNPLVQVQNPTGSGKRTVVEQIWLTSNQAASAQVWMENRPLVAAVGGWGANKLAGGALSATQTTGAGAASWTWSPLIAGIFLQANTAFQLALREPLVLPPGYSLLMSCQAAGAQLQGVVEFYEEPNT